MVVTEASVWSGWTETEAVLGEEWPRRLELNLLEKKRAEFSD